MQNDVSAHDVKRGPLFDDESYMVRQGTEPNLLIAKAAGLEASSPTAMQLLYRPSRFKSGLQFPDAGNTLLGKMSVQVILGADNFTLLIWVKRFYRGKGYLSP